MNTLRFLIALGVILCLVVSPVIALMPANTAQAQPADSAWPMFGQNPQRTGRSPYSGPEVPKQKWSFTVGGVVWSSPAIGADGTIYVGSDDNNLYAINPDGSLKWSVTTGFWVVSSPAIGADGTIYVGSCDGNLYAINPEGSQKWSFTTGDSVYSSPAIGADGTIYVGSKDNKLYAINPDGTQKWSFTTGDDVWSSPAIGAKGTIYVGSDDTKLYAINPDGTQKWSFTTGYYVESSPAIGADGTIYVGSNDNNLYAFTEEEEEEPSDEGCFIATAAYGTPMAEEIEILREFRDEYLLTNRLGQALVDLYYRVSPPIAEFITEHASLKPIVRVGLLPAVAMSAVAVNTTLVEKIARIGLLALVSVALAVWAKKRRGRGPEYNQG
jgi:hypothetical protein